MTDIVHTIPCSSTESEAICTYKCWVPNYLQALERKLTENMLEIRPAINKLVEFVVYLLRKSSSICPHFRVKSDHNTLNLPFYGTKRPIKYKPDYPYSVEKF
jgi:hypothetical protein